MKKKIDRKEFLTTAALAGIGTTLLSSGCTSTPSNVESPAIHSQKKYKWKMVTTWPPNFPVLGSGAVLFADWVRQMSNGRIDIKVYGGGELVPALEVFDAVSSGAAEMGCGASYYWGGKDPSVQFFTSVPFGMNAQAMNAWLISGGGMQLWEEQYAKYNLVPFLAGSTGIQMGGWYNKEIITIEDFKGLKMRMPGLGAKVLERAGGTAVLSAGSEIYTNLERGVIDATEWLGPFHDTMMGFQNITKYYYSPGWHEPGSSLELMVTKRLYDSLPEDLQQILQAAAARLNVWTLSEFEAKNAVALQTIKDEGKVELRRFSPEVLSTLKEYTKDVLEELAEKDEDTKKIYTAYASFQKKMIDWSGYSERLYHKMMEK